MFGFRHNEKITWEQFESAVPEDGDAPKSEDDAVALLFLASEVQQSSAVRLHIGCGKEVPNASLLARTRTGRCPGVRSVSAVTIFTLDEQLHGGQNHVGWVVGAGGEWRFFGSNWLLRVEYLHYDFKDTTLTSHRAQHNYVPSQLHVRLSGQRRSSQSDDHRRRAWRVELQVLITPREPFAADTHARWRSALLCLAHGTGTAAGARLTGRVLMDELSLLALVSR